MRKIDPERLQGIEFIRLSSLPFSQMIRLKNWLAASDIFSIKGQHESIYNCVHYDDYEFWYDNIKNESQLLKPSLF